MAASVGGEPRQGWLCAGRRHGPPDSGDQSRRSGWGPGRNSMSGSFSHSGKWPLDQTSPRGTRREGTSFVMLSEHGLVVTPQPEEAVTAAPAGRLGGPAGDRNPRGSGSNTPCGTGSLATAGNVSAVHRPGPDRGLVGWSRRCSRRLLTAASLASLLKTEWAETRALGSQRAARRPAAPMA